MDIHKRKEWPEFTWAEGRLAVLLAGVRHLQGRLLGRMEGLGFDRREDSMASAIANGGENWRGSVETWRNSVMTRETTASFSPLLVSCSTAASVWGCDG